MLATTNMISVMSKLGQRNWMNEIMLISYEKFPYRWRCNHVKGTTIYTTKSITLNFPLKFLSFVRILSSLRFLFCANSSLCSVRSCTRHGRRKHKHRTEPPKQEQYPRRALSTRQILALSPITIRLSNLPSLYCTDCLAHTRLSTRGRDDAQKSKPCLTVATPSASHPTSCHVPESHFHWIFTSYCSFRLLQPPCYFTPPEPTAQLPPRHHTDPSENCPLKWILSAAALPPHRDFTDGPLQ